MVAADVVRIDYFQDVWLNIVDLGSPRSILGNKDLNMSLLWEAALRSMEGKSGGSDTIEGRKSVQGTSVSKSPQYIPGF